MNTKTISKKSNKTRTITLEMSKLGYAICYLDDGKLIYTINAITSLVDASAMYRRTLLSDWFKNK